MNSSFPNRWSFSYLKFKKYVTNIIAEPKYKYRHQEQVTVKFEIDLSTHPRTRPQYFYTDRSKAVLLLRFLTVTCSCCPHLYFGSAIMLVTYFVNFRLVNDHLFGKNCSFGLPRVSFVNCRQFMYLDISLLALRAGCGI